MTGTLEPRDKLDGFGERTRGRRHSDWAAIDWRQVEDDVRRLRQRIFTATQDGDLKTGPQPAEVDAAVPGQHLYSVRRVTQINAGRHTAGVDGQVVLDDPGRAELAGRIQQYGRSWTARRRCGGCTYRRPTENSGHSEFP